MSSCLMLLADLIETVILRGKLIKSPPTGLSKKLCFAPLPPKGGLLMC